MLFGIGPRDPLTFTAVVALLGAISIVATAILAVRAVRVDPMRALRED
jgi:ABC-type lipoprotein release transport system permease subunit